MAASRQTVVKMVEPVHFRPTHRGLHVPAYLAILETGATVQQQIYTIKLTLIILPNCLVLLCLCIINVNLYLNVLLHVFCESMIYFRNDLVSQIFKFVISEIF